jgi:hypothetical protein
MNFSRALVFLHDLGAKRTLSEFGGGSRGVNGFQFVYSAMRLDILGDDFIYRLCSRDTCKGKRGCQHRNENSHHFGELLDFNQCKFHIQLTHSNLAQE